MKDNNGILQMWVSAIIAMITIGATYLIVDNKTDNISDSIVSKMLAIEYDKVGWMENYVKINNFQKKQILEWLKQWALPNPTPTPAPAAKPTPTPTWTPISLEQVKKVTKEWTYILWNPDAEISWIEYSDLECPFCKKLHDAWTIEDIIKIYDGKVNFIFKQFPLRFHPQAAMESEALLCVWDLAWNDKYYDFILEIFKNSKVNGRSYTKESISELGTTIWVDKQKLLSCIESGKFKQKVQDEMLEWQGFGISWTPWNVLINNKTGKWDTLPWAYPTASFKQKIDTLLQ